MRLTPPPFSVLLSGRSSRSRRSPYLPAYHSGCQIKRPRRACPTQIGKSPASRRSMHISISARLHRFHLPQKQARHTGIFITVATPGAFTASSALRRIWLLADGFDRTCIHTGWFFRNDSREPTGNECAPSESCLSRTQYLRYLSGPGGSWCQFLQATVNPGIGTSALVEEKSILCHYALSIFNLHQRLARFMIKNSLRQRFLIIVCHQVRRASGIYSFRHQCCFCLPGVYQPP